MYSALWLFCGIIFFGAEFIVVKRLLRWGKLLAEDAHCDEMDICMRCVSSTQAILACLSGATIISACTDLLYDRHWLTEPYVMFATGYLAFDTWAMFTLYYHKTASRSCDAKQLSVATCVKEFINQDPAMVFHHVCLPALFLPVVLYYRHGVGDGFIGCFMFIEATIPFIHLRETLVMLRRTRTWLYLVNGLLTLVIYTCCRILIFPLMFWLHGRQLGESWWLVPWLIPRTCIIGCGVFLSLYLYWWLVMVRVAIAELWKRDHPKMLT